MKSFKDYYEEVAANSVSGGGVDLTPSKDQILFRKDDKRKKYNNENMYRRSLGLKFIETAKK